MSKTTRRSLDDISPPEFLTVTQVALILQVSPRQVYRWIDEGQLSAVRLGRIVRIHKNDLNAFIDHLRTGTIRS